MALVARFGRRSVGDGEPVIVIAEVGVNHNGDVAVGLQHVREAASAGADAVKFQTFHSEDVVTTWAPSADYQREAVGSASQLDMIRPLELSEAALRALIEEA